MSTQIEISNVLHLIRCTVGRETYGLDMSWVRSIRRIDRLRYTSEQRMNQGGFVGWLPDKNGDIPVFSLASRLERADLSPESRSLQRIVVLPAPVSLVGAENEAAYVWGLLVDQVSQVISVSDVHVEPLPAIVVDPEKNYFEGVVKLKDGLLLLLSPEWLHPDTVLYTAGVIEKPHQLEARLNAFGQTVSPPEVVAQHFEPGDQVDKQNKRAEPIRPSRNDLNGPDGARNRQTQTESNRLIIFSTRPSQPDEEKLVYALNITQVSEILTWPSMIPVPAAPNFVLGLVNWRNFVIPVIDLDARLGLAPRTDLFSDQHTQLMVARDADPKTLVSFPIRPGARVLRLPDSHQFSTPAPALGRGLVRNVVDWEDVTLMIPDIGGMLGSSL